jgi:ankyrin repeat protein
LEKSNISKLPTQCLQFWCTKNCQPVLRVCRADEKQIAVLLWALLFVIFSLLLSAVASLFIQVLGDDVELYRFFGFVNSNSIKDLMSAKFRIQLLSFHWTNRYSETENLVQQMDEYNSTIKALIEKAEPEILNQPDKSTGNTCLHHAFNKGFYDLLLEMVQNKKGGNLNVRNKDGESIVSLMDLCDCEKIKKTKEAYEAYLKKTKKTEEANESVIFQGKCKNFQGNEYLLKIFEAKQIWSEGFRQIYARIYEGIKTKDSRPIFATLITEIKDIPVGIGWLKELGASLTKCKITADQKEEILKIYEEMYRTTIYSDCKQKINVHIFAQLEKMDELVTLEKKFDIQSLLVWSIPPVEQFLFKKQLMWAKAMKILGANFFSTNAEDKTPSLSYLESFDSHEKLSKGFAKFLILNGGCKFVDSNNYFGFNVLMKSITPHSHQCLTPKDQDEFLTKQQSGLHAASYINCVHCVKLLLSLGSDVNAKNEDNKTSLHYALQDLEMLKILLENKPNADNIQSSLINAIEINNIDAVRLLLDFGADVNNISGEEKETPLHVAADRGNAAILKLLIKKGAYVNRKNVYGNSVLHDMAERGNCQMASQILKAGADVNAKNRSGKTALHLAVKDENLVQLLIDYGADATVCDDMGRLPLHYSALHGVKGTFEILIPRPDDFHTKDKYGATALHLASENSEDNCLFMKYLIDLEADVNATDNNGSTPLHYAVRAGNAKILDILITEGVDVNAIDIFGKTPLALATKICDFRVLQKLIENGANVKHDNSEKSSHSPTLIFHLNHCDCNEDHIYDSGDCDHNTNEIKNTLVGTKKSNQNTLQKLIQNGVHMKHDNLGNSSTSPTLIFDFLDNDKDNDRNTNDLKIPTKGIIGHTSEKSDDHQCPNVITVEKYKFKIDLPRNSAKRGFFGMTLRKNDGSIDSSNPDLTCQKCCEFFGLIFPTSEESLME